MALDISTWKIDRAVFDLRYDPAFLLWDRAGQFWQEASETWQGLTINEAAPSKTNFFLEGRFNITVELEKAVLAEYQPDRGLEDFKDKAAYFHSLVVDVLGVEFYDRIGLRLFYLQETQNIGEAVETLKNNVPIVEVPNGPHFDVDGPATQLQSVLRYEGGAKGVTFRLKTLNREAAFSLGPTAKWTGLEDRKIEQTGIVCDLDFYTLKPTPVEMLSVPDWIDDGLRLSRRDSHAFLGG